MSESNPVSPELERIAQQAVWEFNKRAGRIIHLKGIILNAIKSALALQVEKEKEGVIERYVVESDGKMRVEHPPFLDGPEPQGELANEDEGRHAQFKKMKCALERLVREADRSIRDCTSTKTLWASFVKDIASSAIIVPLPKSTASIHESARRNPKSL